MRLITRLKQIALVLTCTFFILIQNDLMGQSAITAINFTWVDVNNSANDYSVTSSSSAGQSITANTLYEVRFSSSTTTENNRRLDSYTVGGVTYQFQLDPDTLAIRRVGTASRLSLWIEAESIDNTGDILTLNPERQVPEEALYQASLLNMGYDNVLVNSGTNSSNIERIDAIYRTGMLTATPANALIPVLDRGANAVFKIAAILSLDANGDPASYGSLVEVEAGDSGGQVLTIGSSVLFLQQAIGQDPIPTGSSTQGVGGVAISLAELGVAANEIIFGYSLFSIDVNDVDHTLTDISTFPTDSNNSGLDFGAGAVSAVSSDNNLVKATGPGGYKSALSTWLKANAGVTTATDAASVTDWQDQSLGDHDAVTLINAPTYRDGSASELEDVNFNPTVDFLDASETGLQIANNSDFNVGGAPYTNKSFNMVIRTGNDITTKQQVYEQGDDTRGIDIYVESGNLVATAYNTADDSGSGVSSPWNNGGSPTTISTALATDTEYIITFEMDGSASGTGTVTLYLNGTSIGNFTNVGQLADHSDQIGLGDFNSQSIVVTPMECPVPDVDGIESESGITNSGNITGQPDGAFAEVYTDGDVITVDFGVEYPSGTTYELTWRRKASAGSGTAIPIIRESTLSDVSVNTEKFPLTSTSAVFQTDEITSSQAFRYIQITKEDAITGSQVDFDLDAIVVDCSTENITFDQGDAASFYGSIPEFIYCSEPSSFPLAQRQRIESYLALKYGLTLDQATPINYVNSNGDVIFNTTNAAAIGGYLEYNKDIAGIGRDDESEFNQPKSRSENAGSVVTIDRGADISVDNNWLIWGNDGAALTESGILTKPDTIDNRLERVWRVAEEGEVLTTSVSFDLTGLGLSANQNDYSLLIAGSSSNADFSSATVVTGGVISGNTITFSGVDLEDGQYFTLGTKYQECAPGGVETGLQLWVKADEQAFNTGTTLATDGQTVATWGDNSNELTTTDLSDPDNLTTFETNEVNFNPAISFTNDPLSFEGTFVSESVGLTMFIVGNMNSSSSGEPALFEVTNGSRHFFLRNRYAGNTAFSSNINQDSYNLWSIDHPSGNSATITQNSGAFEGPYSTALGNASTGTYTIHLGDDATGGNTFTGFIGELIAYEGTLSATQIQRIESYLAIKYGITIDQGTATNYLAADGGTIWNATDNSGFANDIAGIGRDDNSCLDQRQSKSQNSGSIVTMGLTEIAVDNASNTNSFTTDDSFLVWGNDGASATAANAVAFSSGVVTERMLRIWRADENAGTVGATDIAFDLTGLGYTGSITDLNLIISDDSGLGTPTIIPASTFTNDVVTFNDIDLTDGQYFTLGTARNTCGPGGVTTDLYVWLRADIGPSSTTDNTTVATWSDQSGTSTDATSDGNPPLFKNNTTDNINFNPTLDFDGEFDRLSLGNLANIKSGATNGGDYTMVGVGIRQDGTEWNFVIGSPGGTGNQSLHFGYRNSNTAATLAHWGNDLDVTTNNHDNPQAPFILWGAYDGTGREVEETRGGNFARATDTNTTDLQGSSTNYVGDTESLGNYNGLIPEVIIFDNNITAIQKQQVYSYVALKYGIHITNDADNDAILGETISGSVTEGDLVSSNGTTIVWDYSANTAYHNDVTGIGRDDSSCWSQKQSSSQNTDDILTVGLGSVANTNGENANVFGDDRDYLVWGNDNGATAEASTETVDVPETIAERMARVWKVQDTGTVGATELQFDLTGLNYNVSDASEFSLLVGNTATMADATIITGGTLNGNVLSFSNIDLTDGQFFTIGTQNVTCGPGGVNTDIAVWFRADIEAFSDAGTTLATDGQNVLQWNDQSSPANNASEQNAGGGAPVEPTLETNEINFNPVIRFSNAQSTNNSWLETASNSTSGNMTLISIFKTGQSLGAAADFSESPALISSEVSSGTNDYGLGISQSRPYISAIGGSSDFSVRPVTTIVDGAARILTGTRTQAVSGTGINLFINSENVGSATSDATALNSGGTFAIGNHSEYDTDGQFEGDIAETIVYDKVLSETEQARVETYFALKYGITRTVSGLSESAEDYLAADGGIIWDIDNQGATYHNDIFGIGRDDNSCFEQIKSKSENADAIVTFDHGGSFGTNDSFIISGNDNATLEAENNSERPPGILSRLNREWRVQETGTVGNITLTYDLSNITGPTGIGTNNANQVRLMVDDDGDFTSGVTLISPASIDADNNTVSFTVNFTDGQYYTLGSLEQAALPVQLLSFEASVIENNKVDLTWATLSETNNSFYSIERSRDALNFEVIGTREGAGTSNDIVNYSFIDLNPLEGTSYYRLKQTDFNGDFEYSEIVRINLKPDESPVRYKLYPNPISKEGRLTIEQIGRVIETSLEYEIVTTNGRTILRGQVEAHERKIHLTIGNNFHEGIYLIRLKGQEHSPQTLRFMVK